MTPEGELKKQVLDFLNKTGEFYLRVNSGIVRVKRGFLHLAPEGTADLLIFRDVPHWIELKAGTTKKSRAEKQAEFRDKVLSLGHRHCVARSLDDVRNFLEAM